AWCGSGPRAVASVEGRQRCPLSASKRLWRSAIASRVSESMRGSLFDPVPARKRGGRSGRADRPPVTDQRYGDVRSSSGGGGGALGSDVAGGGGFGGSAGGFGGSAGVAGGLGVVPDGVRGL